jgi:chromosome segregation ATPase
VWVLFRGPSNKPALRLIHDRPGPVRCENACSRSVTSQQRNGPDKGGDAAAQRELLSSSADLGELEKLEAAAKKAQEAAQQKSRELQSAWDEFNSIPEKVEAINARLANYTNEIQSLDTGKLEAEFKGRVRDRECLICRQKTMSVAPTKR